MLEEASSTPCYCGQLVVQCSPFFCVTDKQKASSNKAESVSCRRDHSRIDFVSCNGDERGVSRTREANRVLAMNSAVSLVSAVACAAALHPFDLIKTRMQVKGTAGNAMSAIGKGTIDSAQRIWSQEGIRGLYRGCTATLIGSGVSWGVFRYIYDWFRISMLSKQEASSRENCTASNNQTTAAWISTRLSSSRFELNLTASLLSSYVSTCLVHPLWMVKTRLEMQSKESKLLGWEQYNSWRHCVWTISCKEGLGAFYKGFAPALALAPHGAVQMVAYEELKRWDRLNSLLISSASMLSRRNAPQTHKEPSNSADSVVLPFVWGATAKLIAILLTYPLQSVRALQQMVASPYGEKGMFHVILATSRLHGASALYRGLSVHVQRSCLQNGLIFLIYEHFARIA